MNLFHSLFVRLVILEYWKLVHQLLENVIHQTEVAAFLLLFYSFYAQPFHMLAERVFLDMKLEQVLVLTLLIGKDFLLGQDFLLRVLSYLSMS